MKRIQGTETMSSLKKLLKYFADPLFRLNVNSRVGINHFMSDEDFIKKQYFLKTGRVLNLDNPTRFNEKLQWLKLYNRKPLFTIMVDKYAVKEYLEPIIGSKHIVPLLGVWNKFEDIDFNSLPDKFVIKTTHGCGGMYICREKSKFDVNAAAKDIRKALKRNYYYNCREWPYKDVKPRIIAEKYLQDGEMLNLNVYKIFNLSGKPTLIQSIQNDKTKYETIDYFDTEWNLLDLRQNYQNSKYPLPRPETLEKMLELSAKCSAGFPFLRTDWYEVNKEVFFSEFTFFSDAGHEAFYPDEWDERLGALIDLSLVDGMS